jgi:hypothetical protein
MKAFLSVLSAILVAYGIWWASNAKEQSIRAEVSFHRAMMSSAEQLGEVSKKEYISRISEALEGMKKSQARDALRLDIEGAEKLLKGAKSFPEDDPMYFRQN